MDLGNPLNVWVWKNPAQSSAWISRMASVILLMACAANLLLVRVSREDKHTYEWCIVILAALACVGLLTKIIRGLPTAYSEVGSLIACGMWVAQIYEIWTSTVSTEGKLRNGGFYLSFASMAALLYLTERIGRRTDASQIETATAVVQAVEDVEGTEAHILLTHDPDDTHIVVTPLEEGTIQAVIDHPDTPVTNGGNHGPG